LCGICGIVGLDDKLLLSRMCDVVHHRGPDGSGFFSDEGVGIGAKRLSIIDLKSGHQPLHNEDESIWIVFNGEIYNYRELTERLKKKGHKFSTISDTEVIVHLYEDEGESCVDSLNGMFAFAIWDGRSKRLLLARDRFGIKPLYYTIFDGCLLFASEIKAILQCREIRREMDLDALHEYLLLGYVHHPLTMLKGIVKLRPGHTLTYSKDGSTTHQYWSPHIRSLSHDKVDVCSSNLHKLLRQSVEMEMVSDVPIGAYLSGGLDSSSIVALMSQAMDDRVRTFTALFEGDDPNPARMVADHFHTEHHECMVEQSVTSILPKLVWHLDEPIDDPATVPTFFVSEFAKKFVKVILVGEGADELFGGYQRYKIMLSGDRYIKLLPEAVRTKLFPKLVDLFHSSSRLSAIFDLCSSFGNDAESYIKFFSVFRKEEQIQLHSDKSKEIENSDFVEKRFRSHFASNSNNLLDSLTTLDISSYLVDELLLRVDKMTMANSVEARVPFLNKLLAEFSLTIPSHLKLKGMTEKYILRKAVSDLLPTPIRKRKKKPFSVPMCSWFNGELSEIAFQLLSRSESPLRNYFRSNRFSKIMKGVPSQSSVKKLWRLLILEMWHRLYVENDRLFEPNLEINKLLS